MITLTEFLEGVEGDDFREECQSICACLREIDSRYDWVGIYWLKGDKLVLGPWSGRDATEHTTIPVGEGVCGAAVRENKTIIVDDVQTDPRYLACFTETRSEIVTPIRAKGKLIGEIDIDGREVGAYADDDRKFLEALADHIGTNWPGKW
ncbi:GAF domain-containing protein [candidate division KSB1 bacterium]|nr:GAF domain-containing protein [candidate division KSB1 bacterium]